MGLKTIPVLLLFSFIATLLSAQNKTYQIKADSVRIFSNCDTAELILQNRTRNVLNGVLTNKGNGVTEFRKLIEKLNDSTCLIGGDSIKICCPGTSGSMAWLLQGNTVGDLKKLGTIDNVDLPFITNNAERLRIGSNGNVGIGTASPLSALHIKGAGTTSATASLLVDNQQNERMLSVSDDHTIDFRPNKYNTNAFLRSRTIDPDGRFAFDITDGNLGTNQLFSIYFGRVGFGYNNTSPDHATYSALRIADGRTYIDNLTVNPSETVYGPFGVRGLNITRNSIATNVPISPANDAIRDNLSITGNNIFLNTGNGPATAATINDLGDMGIGTTAPLARLDVNGKSRFNNTVTVQVPDITGDGSPHSYINVPSITGLRLGTNDAALTSINKPLISFGRHNGPGLMLYDNINTSLDCSGVGISPYALQLYIPSPIGYSAYFTWNVGGYRATTGDNEIMRLKNNGNLMLGTTDDNGAKFQVNGNVFASGLILPSGASSGYVLTSDASGVASWQSPVTPSDFNLKENIIPSQFNSNKLLGLTIKDFNYKSDKNKTRYTGLIAQELKLVIPELVLGKEGSYSIDYIKMVPYLLKAIQDQQATILVQQKEIAQLKLQSVGAENTATPGVLAIIQQQLKQQQEEIKLLKEQVKNK